MIGKKCSRCNRKIRKGFSYCPFCGNNLEKRRDKRDFGLIGKEDSDFDSPNLEKGLPFGLDNIFNSLLNQLESEFQENHKRKKPTNKKRKFPVKKQGFSINISTGTGKNPEIKIRGSGPTFQKMSRQIDDSEFEDEKRLKHPKISAEKAKKYASLPREEASTKIKRLDDKVIYEINLPGIKKMEDISINELESSIEIKGFSKEKVYFKLVPVSMPLKNYKLKNEKLVLELEDQS